jgi:hypothetical protein
VDEAVRADVDADVADAVEEDEVAGAERAAGDPAAEPELRVRAVRQVDAEPVVDEADEAGAVEAGARRGAAVAVGDAEPVAGDLDGPRADDGRASLGVGGGRGRAGVTGAGDEDGAENERKQREARVPGESQGDSLRRAQRAKVGPPLSWGDPIGAASAPRVSTPAGWLGIPRSR